MPRTIRRPRRRGGFTVAELLLSITLLAMVLTCMGMAIHGGLFSFTLNDQLGSMSLSARSIVNRMTAEIRTSREVTLTDGVLKIYPADYANGPDEIHYYLSDGVFYYRVVEGETQSDHVLLGSGDSVSVSNFTVDLTTETEGSTTYTVLAKVVLGLQAGDQSRTFTASAAPRQNL